MSCHKSIVYSIILSLCLSGLLTTRVLIKADVVDDVTVNAIQQRARKLPRNFPTRWWPKYSHRDEIWYQRRRSDHHGQQHHQLAKPLREVGH